MADPLELLEPSARAFIQSVRATDVPSLADLSVEDMRQGMRNGQAWPLDADNVSHTTHHVAGCTVHLLRPRAAIGATPGILYLHGGGWVLGGFDTHVRLVQELVRHTGAALVFPEYSLAPEHAFPFAIEQCYSVALWAAENAAELNLDGSNFAIVGDSSGGNLAAVIAALAVHRGGPAFKLQALLCPVTDADFSRASYKAFGNGFYLDTELMRWFWQHYVPERASRMDPLASPLRFAIAQLRGAAPALVLTAECDILRDEGEAYARKLADAGVATAAFRCLGTVHSFLLENQLASSAPARAASLLLIAHLKKALNL